MRKILIAVALVVAAAFPASASAVTYYVSPTGSDSNNGTSTATPWRTVSKVNAMQSTFQPCDFVRFERGASYSGQLQPTKSGTTECYITYSDYGTATGRAALPGGVYLAGADNLTIAKYLLSGSGITGGSAILASSSADTDGINLNNLEIRNWSIGINSANFGNQGWWVRDNIIDETGDSGMIVLGDDWQIGPNNTITDIGKNTGITYGKHGIYLKVSNALVSDNVISRGANGQAVSVRFRNSIVEWNTLSGHPLGIGYFECDSLAGTSRWRSNDITSSSAGIYVSGSDSSCGGTKQTNETFYIDDNWIDYGGSKCMNLVNNGIAVYHVGTIAPNTCL